MALRSPQSESRGLPSTPFSPVRSVSPRPFEQVGVAAQKKVWLFLMSCRRTGNSRQGHGHAAT